MQIGVFWKYWLIGGVIYIYERLLREIRSRHSTYISKVIQHPSKTIEIQIKKERVKVGFPIMRLDTKLMDLTQTRAGQYIFVVKLSIPTCLTLPF